jgi:hypothetical protein
MRLALRHATAVYNLLALLINCEICAGDTLIPRKTCENMCMKTKMLVVLPTGTFIKA